MSRESFKTELQGLIEREQANDTQPDDILAVLNEALAQVEDDSEEDEDDGDGPRSA